MPYLSAEPDSDWVMELSLYWRRNSEYDSIGLPAPMPPDDITIVFSPHAVMRLKQRVPQGHGVIKQAFVRLMLVREPDRVRKALWMIRIGGGVLLGSLRRNRKGKYIFLVITVLDIGNFRVRQRQDARQFIPIEVRLFRVKRIGTWRDKPIMPNESKDPLNTEQMPFAFTVTSGVEIEDVWPTLAAAVGAACERHPDPPANISIHAWFPNGASREMPLGRLYPEDRSEWVASEEATRLERELFGSPTVRQQLTALLRRNQDADYWERLVLRFAEALLATVDEQLRGIPVDEAGLEKMIVEDFENLPQGSIELHYGIPSAKRWKLFMEGRRRLGFASNAEEELIMRGKSHEEIKAEYDRRRAELQSRPFVPSQVPFPSEPPEK